MTRRATLLVAGALLAVPPSYAQVVPEKAEATFTVADGLEFKLWASEPLFVNPTCMDIDHRGRVWVCESVNYRCHLHKRPLNRPEGDRIVILEDTRGTGRADKATTFYQSPELLAPLGIAVAKDPTGPGYKVFVCQSPDILVFEDRDGAGKADGPPRKLLTGFNGYDHDHGVHGILIGPDLKLYFSVGDQGVKDLQSSDGRGRMWTSNNTDCRAGTIWRCDLDGRNLELIAHNFRNEYEPCVDSSGTVFVSDNDDDGSQQTRICYVMPGGDYGYYPRGPGQSHWHEEKPGVVPKILRTWFGSPTGMCVYEGSLLPEKYRGQLLHTDAGPRHVRCYRLKPNGAGYDVDREDIVQSTDSWFRPSDLCVAPDGSVYVADWYDPGVGGHGMGDTTRGRVFRLAPKGHKPAVPKVDLTTGEGVLQAFLSPNLATRYMAATTLRARGEGGLYAWAERFQERLTRDADLRVMWLKVPTRRFEQDMVETYRRELAQDEARFDAMIGRITRAIGDGPWVVMPRALKTRYGDLARAPEEVRQFYRRLARHAPSPASGRELLLALRDSDPAFAKPWIYDLARQYDGKDRFFLEAVGIAVGHHDKARREVILADFEKEFPGWDDKLADLVWELRPPAMLPTLARRLADAKLTPARRARVVDILAADDSPGAGRVLLGVLQRDDFPAAVRDRAADHLQFFLSGKWASLRQSKELDEAIEKLLARAETRATALALIGAAEWVSAVERVAALARGAGEREAVRKAAVQTLGLLPAADAAASLRDLLGDPAVGGDAVRALGALAEGPGDRPGAAEALRALQDVVADKGRPAEIRQAALQVLAGTRPGTVWLLALHDKGGLDPALKADAARLLRNSPHQDLRNRALLAFPPAGKLDPAKLPPIPALAARRGDAARGRELLAASARNDLQCLKCHRVQGAGGEIGPDLSAIGTKASRENLFESLLYPSKAVADQYVQWVIETKKGNSLAGLLIEETAASVTIRDANGKDTRVDKKDIESREKSPKSLMPDDLVAYMTEDDLVDMVEYLLTLKAPAGGK
jgi:putative membrane-bound dehydrogenase-like protein